MVPLSNITIWPIDRALSSAITPGESASEINGNEGLLNNFQNNMIETSLSEGLKSYHDARLGGTLPLCKDSVGVFDCFSQLC